MEVVEVDKFDQRSQAAKWLTNWLTDRLFGSSGDKTRADGDIVSALAGHTAWERVALVHRVLELEPRLARAVRHLPVNDQLKLSFELVSGAGGFDHANAAPVVRPMRSRPCKGRMLTHRGRHQ
jgi:hypothetical protein